MQPIDSTNAMGFTGAVVIPRGFDPRPAIRHALFDFDGTLSLIRQGWPEVMVPLFLELLPTVADETDDDRRRLVLDDIMRLNGKQTIYQMMQLADRVAGRGSPPLDPLATKHEYLRRLGERIEGRLAGLRDGTIAPDAWTVHGARAWLDALRDRGITLYLASGTDEDHVRREADLLGLAEFFGPRIYGARDDYRSFSKQIVIDRILAENAIPGANLVAFGDGYVEVENTKAVGGLAVAVASDEANNGSGRLDEWKLDRLLGVGADVAIPDYRDAGPLARLIWG